MKLTRCENGHFYDAERYDGCPHCNQEPPEELYKNTQGIPQFTEPADNQTELRSSILKVTNEPTKTVGYFGDLSTEPVVGWLVAVAGDSFGTDFKLKTGRNFIGRAADMDVALFGDSTVSRDKHAIILYEPRGNVFLVQPGDAKELFYLNDKVVLAATEISAYDILTIGNTKLMFIPCCSDKFNWDSVKPAEEKK